MTEKCIICEKPATLKMKGTTNYYCHEHAEDLFADISYLVQIESEAQKLHDKIEEKMASEEEKEE